jgi:hypothetical protein
MLLVRLCNEPILWRACGQGWPCWTCVERIFTICHRMSIHVLFCACMMFTFDALSARMNSPNLFSIFDLNTPRYRTRGSKFFRIGFHHPSYGVHEPMSATMREFNDVICLFDFMLIHTQFMNHLKLTLQTYPTLPQNKCAPCAVVHGSCYGLTFSVDVLVASST